ncbi:MAG TPA: serine/threonine-protein kinase [Planctomycetota bacterium]|nr:serine/threonine-protein kinase [Planctomycetota bacterium]
MSDPNLDPDKTRMMPHDAGASTPGVPTPPGAGSGSRRAPPSIPDVEIEGELGRGGMGIVYRGRQTYINRTVAIKVLTAVRGGDSDADQYIARFQREARILAGLSHPHIVGCYQAGVAADGCCFLVMEFIDGQNLWQWIRDHGALPEAQALRVTADIARALSYANEQGIIHRDVKPENILLQSRPSQNGVLPFTPKLVDLGLARPNRAGGSGAMQVTMPGMVMGTPATMAPEQFDDPEGVDHRADIYGLGCVLYHALTGRPAYGGTSLVDIVSSKATGPAPDPRQIAPGLSARAVDLVRSMLAARREGRPQSYQEIIDICEAAPGARSGARAGGRAGAGVGRYVATGALVVALVGGGWWWIDGAALSTAPATTAATAPAIATTPPATGPVTAPATVAAATAPPAVEFGEPQALFAADFRQRLAGWDVGTGWAPEEEGDEGVSGNASKAQASRITRSLDQPDLRLSGVIASGAADPTGHFREAGVILTLADGSTQWIKLLKLGEWNLAVLGKDAAGVVQGDTKFEKLGRDDRQWRMVVTVRNRTLTAEVDGVRTDPLLLSEDPIALSLFVLGGAVAVRDLAIAHPR